jgi:hypothetical protein
MVWSICRRPGAGRNSEPGLQSLQSASEAQLHVSAQMGGGGGKRGPQSAHAVAQSVPSWQPRYSAPGPPPSQSPSEAYEGIPTQSLVQVAIGAATGMRGPQSAQSEP